MGAFFVLLNMVLGIAVPLGIQLLDRERMTREERAWVWTFASWGSAVYNFGPLSLVAWGYVTRSPRYARGLAIGAGLAVTAVAAQGVVVEGFGQALGLGAKQLADNRLGVAATMGAAVVLAVLVCVVRGAYEAVRGLLRRSG